jgi:hypothetical protein
MPKIYIAGPMRGIKYFNFPAFDNATKMLTEQGWIPISPADMDRENGFNEKAFADDYDWIDLKKISFDITDAAIRDVHAITCCSAIYMLRGWEKSKGACAEKAIAEWIGIEVIFEDNDAEGKTVTNDKGGKQSFIAARFDCIPPECLRLLAQCLGFGARKYGKDNWRNIELDDNLAHAMNHINEFRRGDTSEPHLVNAMARITFALAIAVSEGKQSPEYVHPEMLK